MLGTWLAELTEMAQARLQASQSCWARGSILVHWDKCCDRGHGNMTERTLNLDEECQGDLPAEVEREGFKDGFVIGV